MRRLFTSLAAAALALAVALPVAAQNNTAAPAKPGASAKGAKGKRAGGGMKRMQAAFDKLNLTAEQKPKVDALVKEAMAESKKIRESGATPEERKAKNRENMKAFRTKLNGILTSEQQKQFRELTARKKDGTAKAKGKGAKKAKATS